MNERQSELFDLQLARAEKAEKERDEAIARVQRLTELLNKEEALFANREAKLARMSALVDSMQPSSSAAPMLCSWCGNPKNSTTCQRSHP